MPRRHEPRKHTLYQHAAPCASKRSFASEKQALETMEHAELIAGIELGVYHCPYCNKWHLKSQKDSRKGGRRA